MWWFYFIKHNPAVISMSLNSLSRFVPSVSWEPDFNSGFFFWSNVLLSRACSPGDCAAVKYFSAVVWVWRNPQPYRESNKQRKPLLAWGPQIHCFLVGDSTEPCMMCGQIRICLTLIMIRYRGRTHLSANWRQEPAAITGPKHFPEPPPAFVLGQIRCRDMTFAIKLVSVTNCFYTYKAWASCGLW